MNYPIVNNDNNIIWVLTGLNRCISLTPGNLVFTQDNFEILDIPFTLVPGEVWTALVFQVPDTPALADGQLQVINGQDQLWSTFIYYSKNNRRNDSF